MCLTADKFRKEWRMGGAHFRACLAFPARGTIPSAMENIFPRFSPSSICASLSFRSYFLCLLSAAGAAYLIVTFRVVGIIAFLPKESMVRVFSQNDLAHLMEKSPWLSFSPC
jgi:hypothetical protein